MSFSELDQNIIRTLLYYEIFDHPLSADELFLLLPKNSLTKQLFADTLELLTREGIVSNSEGLYCLSNNRDVFSKLRRERERLAQRRLKIAKFMAHIIKRFPFVRGIFISGDLSKGVALPTSDIDYVIVTEPHRLWICRMSLVLFKKTFLLNKKKYFCLNYFISTDNLTLGEQNYYTATEIAHLKPLYNVELFRKYLEANGWIKNFFPNYDTPPFQENRGNQPASFLQNIVEYVFRHAWADRFDLWLMNTMQKIWKKRYPQYDDTIRELIFRCSRDESRAYVGNFSSKILTRYQEKLKQHNLE